MSIEYSVWVQSVLSVAQEASSAIMDSYIAKTYQVTTKSDASPVTEADLNSHHIIISGLHKIDPSIPVLSEEGMEVSYNQRSAWERYWLVDPLDGTKEFIRGTDEFTINIALIEHHIPVIGVVVAPALKKQYWAIRNGSAYFQEFNQPPKTIHTSKKIEYPVKVALSRHHLQEESKLSPLLEQLKEVEIVYCGSALKICLVAEGIVDVYPRFGPTGEWDTAAGQCILETAGGQLLDFNGKPLRYNTRESLTNPGFLAMGPEDLFPLLSPIIVDKLTI